MKTFLWNITPTFLCEFILWLTGWRPYAIIDADKGNKVKKIGLTKAWPLSAQEIWEGTGDTRAFPGLDKIVRTGYIDEVGVSMPALDPLVTDRKEEETHE